MTIVFFDKQYIMSKKTQRKNQRRRRNKRESSKMKRGGDLHKIHDYNNLVQDPQRMMVTSQTPSQIGGRRTRQTRKYYKHGGNLSFAALNSAVSQSISQAQTMYQNQQQPQA